MSRSSDERHFAYLARSVSSPRQCVVLLVQQATTDPSGIVDSYAVAAHSTLDAAVPATNLFCPACHQASATWDVRCYSCGAKIEGDVLADIGVTLHSIYADFVGSAKDSLDIIGQIAHGQRGQLFVVKTQPNGVVAIVRVRRVDHTSNTLDVALILEHLARVRVLPAVSIDRDPNPGDSPHSGELGPLGGADTRSLSQSQPRISRVSAVPISLDPSRMVHKICPQCEAEYAGDMKFCPVDGQSLKPLDARDDLIGHLLGDRYHIVSIVGEGGMGRVYLAEHVRIGRRCAIKVLPREFSQHADAVRRFAREARSASRIAHPNVAAIYDFEHTADGLMYLAMEFVEGESLSKILARDAVLPLSRVIAIGSQAADGIQAAHDLGIVHRDLKPDNIMVGRDRDGGDTVKVVDFGIAKDVGAATEDMTRTGFVVGTPRYMSPEQLSGAAIDARTDVFSLGCVLFEMLTGKGPSDGASGEVLIKKRLSEIPPRPSTLRPDTPAALDDIILTALARDPAKRFPTARSLRDALRRVSIAPTQRRRVAFHLLSVAASVLVAIAVGWTVVLMRPRAALRHPPSAPTRTMTLAPVSASSPPATASIRETTVVARSSSALSTRPMREPAATAGTTPPPAIISGPPPSEAMDNVERDIRMGTYYANKEPVDFAQAMHSFRSASVALTAIERRFAPSSKVSALRQSLDSARAQAHRDCVAMFTSNPNLVCE